MERARHLVTLNYYAFFAWNMCNKCIMGKLCVSIHLFHFWTYLTDSSFWKLMLKIIKRTLFGFVFVQYNPWEPGCILCVMLRLWVGQSRVLILVGQEIFSLYKNLVGLWFLTSLQFNWYNFFFLWGKGAGAWS